MLVSDWLLVTGLSWIADEFDKYKRNLIVSETVSVDLTSIIYSGFTPKRAYGCAFYLQAGSIVKANVLHDCSSGEE